MDPKNHRRRVFPSLHESLHAIPRPLTVALNGRNIRLITRGMFFSLLHDSWNWTSFQPTWWWLFPFPPSPQLEFIPSNPTSGTWWWSSRPLPSTPWRPSCPPRRSAAPGVDRTYRRPSLGRTTRWETRGEEGGLERRRLQLDPGGTPVMLFKGRIPRHKYVRESAQWARFVIGKVELALARWVLARWFNEAWVVGWDTPDLAMRRNPSIMHQILPSTHKWLHNLSDFWIQKADRAASLQALIVQMTNFTIFYHSGSGGWWLSGGVKLATGSSGKGYGIDKSVCRSSVSNAVQHVFLGTVFESLKCYFK